eukprot:2339683-Rhodomonas_salina.3
MPALFFASSLLPCKLASAPSVRVSEVLAARNERSGLTRSWDRCSRSHRSRSLKTGSASSSPASRFQPRSPHHDACCVGS